MVLADVVQYVNTFWRIRDKQALLAAKRMQRQFQVLAATATGTAKAISKIGRALVTPFGMGVGVFAAGGLVKYIADAGIKAEETRLNIAALIQQASRASNLPFEGFDSAIEAAEELRLHFRELAIESPVTSKKISESWEQTAFFLSQAGLGLKEQSEFARDIAVMEKQLGRAPGTVGRDVRQIFQGRYSVREIQTPVLQDVAEQAAKMVRSGKIEEASKLLKEKLAPDKKLLEAYAESYGGLVTTISDRLLILREEASKPLLEYIKGQLAEWVVWIKENKQEAKEFATALGKGIVSALKAIIRLVKFIARNWETIVTTVKTLATVWILGTLGGAVLNVIGLVKTLSGAFSAAGLRLRGILGMVGKLGLAGAAVGGALEYGEAVGEGVARWFTTTAEDKSIARGIKGQMTIAQGEEWIKQAKKRKSADRYLAKMIDPTPLKKQKGGGGGRMKVRELIVDKMSARDRDFARLSTPASRQIQKESFARRPLAGLGLAISTTGG